MVEREIAARDFLRRGGDQKLAGPLLHIDGLIFDHSEVARAFGRPMEDLAAAEGQGEIKLGRRQGGQPARHWRGHWMK